MVGGAGHALTKPGFRRDVRLFLTILGAFFVVLVISLIVVLQSAIGHARDAQWNQWNATADHAADDVRAAIASGGAIDTVMTALRSRYGVDAVQLAGPRGTAEQGRMPRQTATLTRRTPAGTLSLTWDAEPLARLRSRLLFTAVISLAAALIAAILLFLYIPKITRPIEEMLDHAGEIGAPEAGVDEQEFLIDTFKKSIATLKAQQEELRQLHDAQKLRADEFERITAALTRSLTSGFIAVDAQGRVADVNQAGREILRRSDGAPITGAPVIEGLGATALAKLLDEAARDRAVIARQEIHTRVSDGSEIVVGVTTVPLVNEENAYLGMLALFTDLTEIRQLEGRVRDLQALANLGEMSAGIAHEFRNSLATILGYLRLAQRQPTADEVRAKIAKAEEEATGLGSAIDSLLNFARPMSVDAHPTDLREAVESVASRLEGYCDGIPLEISGAATVDADRALLVRAVENVLRNAVDAIREKGSGSIRVDIGGDPPSIRVSDDGIGIDPDAASRLFLPFQSRKPNGLGLGLPLARKILLLHGGRIHVAPGEPKGTVVTMEFPA